MADKSDKKKKSDAKGKKGKDAGAGVRASRATRGRARRCAASRVSAGCSAASCSRRVAEQHEHDDDDHDDDDHDDERRARAAAARARRRVKGFGGLAGFVVGALLAHSAGLSVTSTLERALICGIGSYLLAWGAGRQTTPRARRDTHPARRVGNPARHTRRLIRARRVAVPPPVWRKWAAMNRSESRLAALARVALADGPESRLLAKVRALRALLAAGGRSPLSRGRLLDELRDIAEGEHVTARGVDAQLQACDILRALEAGPRAADELERDPFFPLMVDVLVADELDLRVSPREWRAGSARTRRVAAVVDRLMGEPDPEVAFHEWAARQRARRAA